jgi:S-DNA-T family DNA segregation ATPase FtsK/SpoIIIE
MTNGFRYEEAKAFVLSRRHPNCMEIKRHLHIGYTEAARYMERMEREGIVSPPNNMGERTVLASAEAPRKDNSR